jgi:hypothetical protein
MTMKERLLSEQLKDDDEVELLDRRTGATHTMDANMQPYDHMSKL